MVDREKLLSKIKALTAKTVAAGCTEEEALAAAEKAAALMRDHAISEVLLEMDKSSIGVKFNVKSAKARLCSGVAYVTNCAIVHSRDGRQKTVYYVGFAPGPEIACYLHDVTHRAIETATKEFRASQFYRARRTEKTKRKAVEDFTVSMVDRLIFRLDRMFQETISQSRREKANEALDELFPSATTVRRKPTKQRFEQAGDAGRRAGDRVNLARGVDTSAVSALIGRS
jgi:hypothetical protein